MPTREDWTGVVRSIRRRRAADARFFKPVCVIAAIDLAEANSLDAADINADAVVDMFARYVLPFFPERARLGWQPLWHLTNDGLWTFFQKDRILTSKTFGPHGKPGTKARLFNSFDRLEISSDLRALWGSSQQRRILRDQMLLILADDDASCQTLVRPLFNAAFLGDSKRWPTDDALDDYLQGVREQLLLRFGGKPEATSVPTSPHDVLLSFNPRRLPKESALGPKFRATGRGPITLSADPATSLDQDQVEFHQGLLTKTERLLLVIEPGRNRTAVVRETVESFRTALGERPDTVRVRMLWTHGNTLRRLNDADIRTRKNPDPDDPPLPEQIGELLGDLVQQFNVYSIGDDLLCSLDHNSLGPSGRADVLNELEAGRQLVSAIQSTKGIMDEAASALLSAAAASAESASRQSGVDADQALANALEIERNGGVAIVRSAFAEAKEWGKLVKEGAGRQVGAELVKQLVFVPFVGAYQAYIGPLLSRLGGMDAFQKLVELFRSLFHHS